MIQPFEYLSFLDGASKANRLMIEGLALRGHTCRVLGWSGGPRSSQSPAEYAELLRARGIAFRYQDSDMLAFEHHGVTIRTLLDASRWCAQLHHSVAEFQPDCILVSEYHTLHLLEAALAISTGPVVYIAHSQASLPFGPESFVADPPPARALLLQRASRIITVSHYVKSYIERWGQARADVVYFPVYGSGPFPRFGRFDSGHVTMINPSSLKGISIFLELARRFPHVPFAAIPTWATTQEDRDALARVPNISVWPPMADIDELYARIRVLLVPSLWGEAFGQVVVEAMLRGVPVLASNVGGLPEAKLGVDHVLPVQPITRYQPRTAEQRVPVPVVPPQDIAPWEAALGSLLGDRTRHDALSQESRDRAIAFVESRSVEPIEAIITHAIAGHRAREPSLPG